MDEEPVFIDTPEGISTFVDYVTLQETRLGDAQPPLYFDIEGERLSRYGKVSLLTVIVYAGKGPERTHIIDIHTLGDRAFSTAGKHGKTLKNILESPQILKVFFDVRNDSDALYAHYGIQLQGIRDVQLMENACRQHTAGRRYISGLSTCIEGIPSRDDKARWRRCKEKGEALWNPQKGGSYSVFNKRPLPSDIVAYCVGDVRYLPMLYFKYRRGTEPWNKLIAEESQRRVSASHSAEYRPDGPERTLSPWSAEQNRQLDLWNAPRDYFSYEPDDDLDDLEYFEYSDDYDNDYEDWTRAPWQGPPS
ncbi:ribonuclease H-like domain-containing protein [Aspergillus lucknowensis]|uniref:Ribonuclease H-like domain-containing protein n=1 Tax=Aspergillus lucknowensis TaxID=176173 RepID=A0ABR4LYD5_9EURO